MLKGHYKYILLMAALLAPYIALCFFAHPMADDYSYAHEALTLGYWPSQLHEFLHWNGRYTSNLLVLGSPLIWHSFAGYRLAALALILLTLLSAYFLISSIWDNSLSFSQKLLGALVFSTLLLGMLPSLAEGIYWFTGAVSYQFGSIAATIYAGLMFRYMQRRYLGNKNLHIALCILTLFITIGFNEVLMLMMLATHILVWLSLNKQDKLRSYLFRLMLCAVLFSFIMILAPGNSTRSMYFSNNHRLFYSLGMTALQMIRFFITWVSFAPLILASLLFIGIRDTLYERSPMLRAIKGIKLWQAFSLLWLIIFLCVFPAYWNTGILGQHRTLNAACYMFIPAWFLFIHIFCNKLEIKGQGIIFQGKMQGFIFLLLAACLLFSGNGGNALVQLGDGEVSGFNTEMNARYAKIEEAKAQGINSVYLPILKNRPSSLFTLDIRPGCSHWINNDYALYFGIGSVCTDTTSTQRN